MNTQTAATPQQQESHFWIMTIQTRPNSRGSYSTGNLHGTLAPGVGQTRQDIYQDLRNVVAQQYGVDERDLCVLFFSLEPNQL